MINNKEVLVLNYEYEEGKTEEPLIAKSEADLSREHAPSISTILENQNIKWEALNILTGFIKKVKPNPKQEDSSSIKQAVMQEYESEINGMKDKLKKDLKLILEKTTFTLMQRSLNSSLNKHS